MAIRSTRFTAAAGCLLVALGLGGAPSLVNADEGTAHDIAGIYEMDGSTTVAGAPDRFHVSGKLVIRQEGKECGISVDGAYRRVKGTAGPSSAKLIGTGDARLDGAAFSGTATVQTIISEVPGVDVDAAYMPKKFGPTLNAIAEGRVVSEGVLEFEIRSTLSGEGFTLPQGRRTIVRATRVARSATELKPDPTIPPQRRSAQP